MRGRTGPWGGAEGPWGKRRVRTRDRGRRHGGRDLEVGVWATRTAVGAPRVEVSVRSERGGVGGDVLLTETKARTQVSFGKGLGFTMETTDGKIWVDLFLRKPQESPDVGRHLLQPLEREQGLGHKTSRHCAHLTHQLHLCLVPASARRGDSRLPCELKDLHYRNGGTKERTALTIDYIGPDSLR